MPQSSSVPDFALTVNGVPLPLTAMSDIRSIRVDETLGALSMFTIELYCWDPVTLSVTWPDDPVFAVGNQVTISLGYVDALTDVMTAEITGLEPAFADGVPPTVTVRGHDHRHRLARGRRTRGWATMKDSAIAAALAVEAGLRSRVVDSETVHNLVLQSNQSDLEFLRERAALIGFEFFVRDRVLHFHPPADDQPPAMVLDVFSDLTGFAARLSSLGQSGTAEVRGWDPRAKQPIVAKTEATDGGADSDRAFGLSTSAVVVDASMGTTADATHAARGLRLDLGAGYVRGEAELAGRPDLHAGTTVTITGAGKAFSGPYYVTAVRHDFDLEQGFSTSFDVRRSGV